MTLVAFMQASNVSVYAGSWRYPSTEHNFLSMSYYQEIGRVLERGNFDLLFFDDRLAMPGIYGGSVAEAVKYGARTVKLDLTAVLAVTAAATQHIGLGATYSTTYHAPFHVARTFATLDHLTNGRAAWNIVTSVNDSEAQNFGISEHLGHDARYDRADEFVEVVQKLWNSWDDDALVLDRATGVFADPEKVRPIDHKGVAFDVRGPLTVPRSPQGQPVLLQAGQSQRGGDFAARWAEVIFTADPSISIARSHYADQRERLATSGRDPNTVSILPMAYVIVGETEEIAREKERIFLDLAHPVASLTLLSEMLNTDLSSYALDDIVTDDMTDQSSGMRGMAQAIRKHIGGSTVRVRDLAMHRATLLQGPRFVGTATAVADQMEEWFNTGACDGFVLAATHLPGSFEEFVRMVVPELQARGLAKTQYEGSTLRENLRLNRPSRLTAK